ncbi:hypothetical protein NY546_09430 [Curtobacterium flaccumfaciens pv. flaccumfaciens]|uniref:hypothetical protein n=1 Tax=Curtobacterium flaccumfaciens TaxID=2035 RepID=UPI002659D2CE|nr:hypothetical protein [Curtobacterium flaccumfaciens]MCS5509512.1 hypothetical protein [Curtobacterium flaccumfaciens pv. flaccumfaciens]MCX2788061.1 hypothetical protein [Curtobacterium flaccumfaciens pv. flaccumfaciens]
MPDYKLDQDQADFYLQRIGELFADTMRAIDETRAELSTPAAKLDSVESALEKTAEILVDLTPDERSRIAEGLEASFADTEEGVSSAEIVSHIWDLIQDEPWAGTFILRLRRGLDRPQRLPIFLESLIIRAVTELDSQMINLAGIYFQLQPKALAAQSEPISLLTLLDSSDLDSVLQTSLEAELDKKARGGLKGWKAFFNEATKTDFKNLGEYGEIVEIYERRHCLVHHRGRVSRQYKLHTGSPLNIGEPLHVDEAYVARSIETLELFGIRLTGAAWKNLIPERFRRDFFTEQVAFDALSASRWSIAEQLYKDKATDPANVAAATQAQVNIWIAKAERDGLDSVEREINSWDVSILSPLYQFAKYCLLRDNDAAFDLLPKLLESEALRPRDLATWPLTARLRSDARIEDYRSTISKYLQEEKDEEAEMTSLFALTPVPPKSASGDNNTQ